MADEDLTLDQEPPERDPDTADMFGAPAPAPAAEASAAYTVLARKYRPHLSPRPPGQISCHPEPPCHRRVLGAQGPDGENSVIDRR